MMLTRSISHGLVLVVLMLVSGAWACTVDQGEPPRPASVPEEALWIGGTDGGVFVLIREESRDPAPLAYHVQIFYEHGEAWYDGPLEAPDGNEPPIDITDRSIYSAWDGDSLNLRDGRALRVPASREATP